MTHAALTWCLAVLSLSSRHDAFVVRRSLSSAYKPAAGRHSKHQASPYLICFHTPCFVIFDSRWNRDSPPVVNLRGGGGRVQQVATQEELEQVLSNSNDALVVIDFTATWCGPCQKISPVFELLSQELTDVVFIQVDVDENEETAQKYDVVQMPTFLFMRKGEVVDQFSGASVAMLREKIEALRVDGSNAEAEEHCEPEEGGDTEATGDETDS
ncbi:unnamed protein product [Ectocarpus sp. 13 AM-2016]